MLISRSLGKTVLQQFVDYSSGSIAEYCNVQGCPARQVAAHMIHISSFSQQLQNNNVSIPDLWKHHQFDAIVVSPFGGHYEGISSTCIAFFASGSFLGEISLSSVHSSISAFVSSLQRIKMS